MARMCDSVNVAFKLVPIHQCGSVPSGAAVISEELARTQGDVDAIFGPSPGGACTATRAHDPGIRWLRALLRETAHEVYGEPPQAM